MGNAAAAAPKLKRQWTSNKLKHGTGDDGFARYNERELTLLDRMFQDLARRSPEKTMSKETFLDYFGLPGILGERLFAVFDTKKNGVIDFEEFVNGLGRYNRGSMNDKIDMLFELYDLDGQAYVTKEELSIILFSLITPTTALFFGDNSKTSQKSGKGGLMYENNKLTHVSKITRNTVERLVQEAFEHCDTDNSGKLSKEQFELWVKMNPSVMDALETVFVKHVWSGFEEEDTGDNENEVKDQLLSSHASLHRLDSPRLSLLPKMSPLEASQHEIALPRQSIPPHFQPLYSQLQEQYIEDSMRDQHEAFICRSCKYKYYKSMYVDDTSDPEYAKYVLFKQENSDNGNNNNSGLEIVLKFCPQCGKKLIESSVKMAINLQTAMTLTTDMQTAELLKVGKSGNLSKLGAKFHTWVQRYYVIKDKFLYSFKKKDDVTPTNVTFISGWFISSHDDDQVKKGYYAIEMQPPHTGDQPKAQESNNNGNDKGSSNEYKDNTNHSSLNTSSNFEQQTRKVLYCRSIDERNEWVIALQQAASTIAIENDYHIGKVLGKGHFSVVHLGTHKQTSKKFAIKIVEKKRIDTREKMALRNEISIMKLVNHPCIISMVDVYEDKKCIYMVMTLVEYGDFFGRWQSKKNFKEDTIRIVIWKLLDALHYLHGLGIVHRDLKPENILCTDKEDDTKLLISDFGLSKFAAPHTEMTMSCGTLAYVAPEVLKQKGYSWKVDLWSLGCIMHLLIRNVLPFDGRTKEQVIERTLNKKLDLVTKPVWKTITAEAKNLLAKLLEKDPLQRIDLQSALDHPWFDVIRYDSQYPLHHKVSADLVALTAAKSIPSSPMGSDTFKNIMVVSPKVGKNGNNNNNNNNNATMLSADSLTIENSGTSDADDKFVMIDQNLQNKQATQNHTDNQRSNNNNNNNNNNNKDSNNDNGNNTIDNNINSK